jgi:ATP-binding cassette, subfamily B, bacterial PglK
MNLYKKLKSLLTHSERKHALLVFLLMLVAAVVEMIGVASILPFMAVLANPEVVETNAWLAAAYQWLGFTSQERFLLLLGFLVFAAFIGSLALKALTTYAITRFTFMRLHTISCRLLGAYLRQPYEFFLGRNTADLGKRVLQEVQQVTSSVLLPSMQLTAGAVVAAAILGLLLAVEPMLSFTVAVVLGGAFAGIYLSVRRLLSRIGSDRVRANRERSIFAVEALNGIKELRLLGREEGYLERFHEPSGRFARHQATNQIIGTLPQYVVQSVAFGGILVLMLALLARYGSVQGALPFIAMYALAGYRLLPAFQQIFTNLTKVRFNAPALDVLFEDLTRKEHTAMSDGRPSKTSERLVPARQIQLDHITYYYPNSLQPAIHDLNLTITAGECIGLIGTTGAGKSTAVDLILGLLCPTGGNILVDGQPLDATRLRAWQNAIGYVPQSIYLTDDSIKANIALGIPLKEIDDVAVERAARAAQIHDFIDSELPLGYDTIVGERGVRLSGGQRQRIGIARALYHNPTVLIFDEATSALDNLTEQAVMQAVYNLGQDKTIIIIAHRLSTVKKCNFIFLLDQGRVTGMGTYEELAMNNKKFQTMAAGIG